MKKNLTFIAFAISILLSVTTGCKKDTTDPLIGTWQYSFESQRTINGSIVPVDVLEELTFNEDNTGKVKFTYKTKDGNVVDVDEEEFTYSKTENTLTIALKDLSEAETVTYVVDGDKLRVKDEDGDITIYTRK